MGKSKHGKIDGQFVYMLYATLDSPAYRATSHGAKALYLCLKRRVSRGRDTAYISFRIAQKELKASPNKIREWFAELEHYGFIVLAAHGCLGVDGKGKAPHWRLTELGTTSKTSATGLPDGQTREFMRWNGVPFDPLPFRDKRGSERWVERQKQNPVTDVRNTPLCTYETPPFPTSITPKTESVTDGVHIQADEGVTDVRNISSLTTTVVESGRASGSPSAPSAPLRPSPEGPLEGETKIGLSEEQNNVVHLDPRIASLEAVEKRRKLR